jgi:hypothetical protein
MSLSRYWAAVLLVMASVQGALIAAPASTNDNPYLVIANRNAFNVQPPPPPPVDDPPAPPAVDIKFTGVSTVLSDKRAMLMIFESGKVGPKFHTLAEGEKVGDLEVVSIDTEIPRVRIRLRGENMALTFETHGAKKIAAPTPPPPQAPAPTAPQFIPPPLPAPPGKTVAPQ